MPAKVREYCIREYYIIEIEIPVLAFYGWNAIIFYIAPTTVEV
jgi:hypothetical protein